MFFNEENTKNQAEISDEKDMHIADTDISLDAAGDSPAAANSGGSLDLDTECGDLGFGDIPDDPFSVGNPHYNGFEDRQTVDLETECGDCNEGCGDLGFGDIPDDPFEVKNPKYTPYEDRQTVDLDDDLDLEDVGYSFGDIPDDPFSVGTAKIHNNLELEEVDLDFDAVDTNSDVPVKDTEKGVGLDFDETKNSGSQDDTVHETIDLDFDDIKRSGSQDDTVHETIDLDFDATNNQTDTDDSVHECGDSMTQGTDVAPAINESMVRVFQRKNYNLIMESDLRGVVNYYGNKISLSEALTLVADYHNIDRNSLKVSR